MNTDPIPNDPNNPLISILIYNYNGQYLQQCLQSIFHQNVLNNFEVILVDDATTDGSWEIALEYLNKYSNRITVNRNRRVLGPIINLENCRQMAKGRYCTLLSNDHAFLPEYIKNCVKTMGLDLYAKFNLVERIEDAFDPAPSIMESPLVSILCYNYNYGCYLRECLESVFSQTYQNIELCFSDNASSDESWEIALEFARKYPKKMHLTRNRKNFGPDANFANSRRNMQGKYYVNFCSDDVLEPRFVEQCVNILETHKNVGLTIVNRTIIDELSNRKEEPPFYNQSCIIPGEEQAAVYMMAGINPSVSQIMYRRSIVDKRTATGGLVARYYGTRILDFNVSTDYDIGFIAEPLLLHRIHSQSDTSQADTNLMPIIGLYVLNHQLADIATVRNLSKVTNRLPKSINKLANLAIRYSVRSLIANDEQTAKRYFYLSLAFDSEVITEPSFEILEKYWKADDIVRADILEQFIKSSNLTARNISYEPPRGSIPIFLSGKVED